jgi:hypothetical protein
VKKCRCGFDGTGAHPCHFGGYTCGRQASQRFYNARPVSLAGMQMKVEATDTWACDEHWAEFHRGIKTETAP